MDCGEFSEGEGSPPYTLKALHMIGLSELSCLWPPWTERQAGHELAWLPRMTET